MAEQFKASSEYYDLLYSDKDYAAEVEYLDLLIRTYAKGSKTLLELGCGTGRHAELLCRKGFQITGVDLSEEMLIQAQMRIRNSSDDSLKDQFKAVQGDVRSFRIDQRFDAVISLFHVVSYQTKNSDVSKMFSTASTHLESGGLFIFDVWYGPAVLSQTPSVRTKRMENDKVKIQKVAEPEIDLENNRVVVDNRFMVTNKSNGYVEEFHETHAMRYFFAPELKLIAEQHNLEMVHSEEWLTGETPSEQTWGVCFVTRKL